MKQKFSPKWKASKQPRKQRKYRANAPLNIKHKLLSANLSKELRKKYGKRNFPLRKEDKVKVMKGEFKGKTGRIGNVNMKKLKVMIEGIHRTKKEGTKLNVIFDPSNLQIQELNLEDKKRIKAIERQIPESKKKTKKEITKVKETKKEETKKENNQKSDKIKFKKLPKEAKGE